MDTIVLDLCEKNRFPADMFCSMQGRVLQIQVRWQLAAWDSSRSKSPGPSWVICSATSWEAQGRKSSDATENLVLCIGITISHGIRILLWNMASWKIAISNGRSIFKSGSCSIFMAVLGGVFYLFGVLGDSYYPAIVTWSVWSGLFIY